MLLSSQSGWILIAFSKMSPKYKNVLLGQNILFFGQKNKNINKYVAHLHMGHLLFRLFNEEIVLASNYLQLRSNMYT